MNKPKPPADFDENPEWTEEDFAQAKPAHEVLPAHALGALVKKRGRPAGSKNATRKEKVGLRVDPDVLAAYKAGGPGWQTRMNEALRKGLGG